MNKQIEDEGLTCAYLLGKSEGYQQGKADGAREFAEWAEEKGYFDDYHAPFLSDMLAEWQKGKDNE